jgi:hypothetical protein
MLRIWGIVGVLTLAWVPWVSAQTVSGPFLAGEVGIGLETDDLVDGSSIGGSLGYRFSGGLLLVGNYLYAGTNFYYFENGAGWRHAPTWSAVPSGSSSRSDWIFYRRRHVIGFGAGLSGRLGPVGVFGTAGLMLNVVAVSEAEEYYPEFRDAAEESSIAGGRTLATTALRGGLTYPAHGSVAGTLSWMVNFDSIEEADSTAYFRRNSLILLGVSVQAGGS